MNQKRLNILAGILLILLATHLSINSGLVRKLLDDPPPKPLTGKNLIKNIEVYKKDDSSHWAKIDYFYTGHPTQSLIVIMPFNRPEQINIVHGGGGKAYAKRGHNTANIKIHNPRLFNFRNVPITNKISVAFMHKGIFHPSLNIKHIIEWPSIEDVVNQNSITGRTIDEIYNDALNKINTAESYQALDRAKYLLKHILLMKPKFVPAHIQMARITMSLNRSKAGLAQAEKILLHALDIDKLNANIYVLLGHVYTNQHRFDLAEKEFIKAVDIGTNNLWLWTNWGDLYALKGMKQHAIDMYMKAIDGKRPYNDNDRARLQAYRKALRILDINTHKIKMEILHMKRAKEFSNNDCFKSEHASFLLKAYGDYVQAQAIAKEAVNRNCRSEDGYRALGMSYYYEWKNTSPTLRDEILVQARTYYKQGPILYYDMAKTKHGQGILHDLLLHTNGNLDEKDYDGKNSLALALLNMDTTTAKNLIDMGADINSIIGTSGIPISLIPITNNDLSSIKMLKQHGIDYSSVKFKNMSAIEFARKFGNSDIINEIELEAVKT